MLVLERQVKDILIVLRATRKQQKGAKHTVQLGPFQTNHNKHPHKTFSALGQGIFCSACTRKRGSYGPYSNAINKKRGKGRAHKNRRYTKAGVVVLLLAKKDKSNPSIATIRKGHVGSAVDTSTGEKRSLCEISCNSRLTHQNVN